MEKYIKELISKLTEIFGYKIAELKGFSGLSSDWCAIKTTGDSTRILVFSELHKLQEVDIVGIKENIIRQTGAFFVDVIILYLATGSYNDKLQYFMDRQYKGIVLNSMSNEVIYSNGVNENTLNEIMVSMNHMEVIRTAKKPARAGSLRIEWPVTYTLIAINVAVYALTALLSRDLINSNINVLVFLGAKVNSLIAQGQYFRLITCMFLHGGIIHLAFNMYALYAIGPVIENFFGRWRYLAIYFISGICSSLLSFVMSPGISVGASGAIFGILGACLVFAVKMKNRIGKDFLRNVIAVIAINLFIGFSLTMVDNFGHLGGLIGGLIASIMLFRGHR
ncbi:MAG: rhomboid family intramembrane serine protease [Clostridiaceae bacterium]